MSLSSVNCKVSVSMPRELAEVISVMPEMLLNCTSNGVADIAAGDLLAQIRNAPLIRCDEIAWQMFGITMPNLNVIASALFAALWIMAYLRARRGV